MSTPELSVQLYTVRDALTEDTPGTLGRLAESGFRNVEAFGFVGRAAELRAAFDAAGLVSPSAHAGFLTDEVRYGDTVIVNPPFEQVLDDAETLGATTLIDPMVSPDRWQSIEEIRATADRLNSYVDAAEARGIRLGYHNHSQEFIASFDGVSALEAFTALLDPRIVLEVDVYWAAIGGQDVRALLRRLGDRVRLLHMKDGILGEDPFRAADPRSVTLQQRIAGTGEVPLREVLAAAPAAEFAVVEFDTFDGDLFGAIDASAAFLREEGVR